MWNPSHVQFTVLRARNLIAKGKGGNNDVFVTIQLGKEKYQTSTIKNAHNPEWFEECDLPIPHMHSEIEVNLFHRGVLSDDFLGYASIPLWDYKVGERPKSQWVSLRNKPTKELDNKLRGQLELKLTFHVESRTSSGNAGLKKRSSSIKTLASAFGDKLGFSRSKSFRENRKDPEGSKSDRRAWQPTNDMTIIEDKEEQLLSRSYSMSAAYIKSMSLDRGTRNINNNQTQSQELLQDQPSSAISNIPGNRRSCVEFSNYTIAPPPYNPQQFTQDDTAILLRGPVRNPVPKTQLKTTSPFVEAIKKRERAMYESIRERTEPESSSSSDEVDAGLARARPRRLVLNDGNRENDGDIESIADVPVKRSATPNGTLDSGEVTSGLGESLVDNGQAAPRSEGFVNGDASVERKSSSGKKIVPVREDLATSIQSLQRENGQSDVVLRRKSKRDRIKKHSKHGRRYTVQGLDYRGHGLYDESLSDLSDTTKHAGAELVREDLMATYRNLTKDELIHLIIQNRAQMIRKDRYIGDLENYIDDLLVRVMETQPRLLQRARPPRF